MIDVDEITTYHPQRDGGCAVAFGYDVDMPGDPAYLYDRRLGWLAKPGSTEVIDYCHGHLNEDVIGYVRVLMDTAEEYDARFQFFLQGNTLEDPPAPWVDAAKRGHAVDSHMYTHVSLLEEPPPTITEQLKKTKRLIEEQLGTENIGLRGPGGYPTGLKGREEVQQAVLAAGIRWISCQFPWSAPASDRDWVDLIPTNQPYLYPSGLLEIPFSGHQDRSFFDVDMKGSPRPIEEWIAYLKQCVDLVYAQKLFLCLTVHPSTSFKHDPQARYVREILAYCRSKPDIVICTYRDIYRWLAASEV